MTEEEKRISDSIVLLKAEYVKLDPKTREILPNYDDIEGIRITFECCLAYKLTTLTRTFLCKSHIKKWLKENTINIRNYPEILKVLQEKRTA